VGVRRRVEHVGLVEADVLVELGGLGQHPARDAVEVLGHERHLAVALAQHDRARPEACVCPWITPSERTQPIM